VRGLDDPNVSVAKMLLVLIATVAGLAILCVVLPLVVPRFAARPTRHDTHLVVFFAAIGFGFMFVEIALLQRLALFLGHPTYALGVVLFGLLASSGLGAWLLGRGRLAAPALLGGLALLVAAAALAVPSLASLLQAEPTPVRIAVALALIAPAGLLMGSAFPLGVRAAQARAGLLPWLWGLNGAASVLASVIAVPVALEFGIVANLWIGAACYLAAAAAVATGVRRQALPAT